jgi:hypothetical protein
MPSAEEIRVVNTRVEGVAGGAGKVAVGIAWWGRADRVGGMAAETCVTGEGEGIAVGDEWAPGAQATRSSSKDRRLFFIQIIDRSGS